MAERQRTFTFPVHIVSLQGGRAAPPWKFDSSAHVQTSFRAAGDSFAKKGAIWVFWNKQGVRGCTESFTMR